VGTGGDDGLFVALGWAVSQATSVGMVWTGYDLQITAIDPLADEYADLYRGAGVSPPIVPLKLDGEKLSSRHVHQPQRNQHALGLRGTSLEALGVFCNSPPFTSKGGGRIRGGISHWSLSSSR